MTLAQAKEIAKLCRALVKQGRDPKTVLEANRNRMTELAVPDAARVKGWTFDELLRQYAGNYNFRPVRGRNPLPSTVSYYLRRLGVNADGEPTGNGVLSHWQGRIYATLDGEVQFDEADAVRPLKDMHKSPAVANKTVEALKRFGRWAVWAKRAKTNPFADLQPVHADETIRERLLSDVEIKAVWRITDEANEEFDRLYGASGKLMLLTACRAGTARRARWQDFDLDGKVWFIPPEEHRKRRIAKLGRHPVPLSALAVDLLAWGEQVAVIVTA